MADDLIKGEWSKSKFLDMMKEYPEKIAKINDETVKVLNEQLNSCDEVNLFKEEISKKKLISSKEYELNKNILFAYDTGVTVSQPITLSHDHNLLSADEEVQSDVEELGYNAPNTIEKPQLKIGKTIWKGVKHFAKAFARNGWNADITDFFDGTVKEASDFAMLVGETYGSDSRFKNNFDGVFSKIIGNSDADYTKIINNILDNCIDERTTETTEKLNKEEDTSKTTDDLEHLTTEERTGQASPERTTDEEVESLNTSFSKKIFEKLNELKPLLSISSEAITNSIKDEDENHIYSFIDSTELTNKFIISDAMNVKKYNVIINFTDYLVNKWRRDALFTQMMKNSKAKYYPGKLIIFTTNIKNIIKNTKDDSDVKTIKTVLLYNKMKEKDLDKAIAFMLYVIYLAKANYDHNTVSNKSVDTNELNKSYLYIIEVLNNIISVNSELATNIKIEGNKEVNLKKTDDNKGIIIAITKQNITKVYTIENWVEFINKNDISRDKKLKNLLVTMNTQINLSKDKQRTLRIFAIEFDKFIENNDEKYKGLKIEDNNHDKL